MLKNDIETLDLVSHASMGDRKSMEQLLVHTRPRLFAYLYRMTLDYHKTEDLLQEVQMEIVQSLWRLQKKDLFWPWILKYAWGKAQHSFRDSKRKKATPLSALPANVLEDIHNSSDDDLPREERTELLEVIIKAMKKLKAKQRSVFSMRCYEQMSFEEIASLLECSETNARVLFFRARRNIKRQIRWGGFKVGMLLTALGLFGRFAYRAAASTAAAAKSAATPTAVSASSLEVGLWGSFVGWLTSELGLLFSTLFTAAVTWFTYVNIGLILVIMAMAFPFIVIGFVYYLYSEQ